jgi:ammonium transporter, Amt family
MGVVEDVATNAMEIKKLKLALAAANTAADKGWIMCAGVLVFFMNAGFALLESGTVRFKNF